MTLAGRVSPFGHLRIKARLPAPRSLSQATASFIACNRQGIHHVHLVACPYNVDLWDVATPKTLHGHAVCTTVDACLIRYNHNPSAHPRSNCERVTLRIIDLYYFFQFVKEHMPPHSNIERIAGMALTHVCSLLPGSARRMVEVDGIEPTTPCLQSRCSPS